MYDFVGIKKLNRSYDNFQKEAIGKFNKLLIYRKETYDFYKLITETSSRLTDRYEVRIKDDDLLLIDKFYEHPYSGFKPKIIYKMPFSFINYSDDHITVINNRTIEKRHKEMVNRDKKKLEKTNSEKCIKYIEEEECFSKISNILNIESDVSVLFKLEKSDFKIVLDKQKKQINIMKKTGTNIPHDICFSYLEGRFEPYAYNNIKSKHLVNLRQYLIDNGLDKKYIKL